MSIDLKVKLKKPFSTEDLLLKTNHNLKIILNRKEDFVLNLGLDQVLVEENETFATIVREVNFRDDIVELTVLFQEPVSSYGDMNEDGWWAIVTIRSANNAPMKYALAAALSVSLARIQNSLVIDENKIWSCEPSIKPESLINKIKNNFERDSLNQALEVFLKRIYNEKS